MAITKHENKRNVIDVHGITVVGGQALKVETTPGGDEVLIEECPEGQTWTVTMHIEITITD